MSNILLAWEFGENWGHLSRDLPVARQLRAAGHQVLCAVYDTRIATEVLAPAAIPFVQAPMSRRIARTTQPIDSYAEMLIVGGYGERDTLHGLIGGWLGLFELFNPDVVVIDYAPTALLAARIAGVPTVLTGSGFELPPLSSPLPSFRTWEKPSIQRHLLAEEVALRNINHVLAQFQTKPLAQFADIFHGERKIITTFPELDHYGERSGQIYAGPVFEMPQTQSAQWHKTNTGPRIFAYLRPWIPDIEDLLHALQASGANVICAFPGVSATQLKRFQSPLMQILPTAVTLEPLLTSADLVIGYGSGTVAAALLAGVPLLVIPRWSEQYLTALRVEALGAGLPVRGKQTQASYAAMIVTLLSEPGFRTAAKQFAKKYEGFDTEQAVTCVVDSIQSAIAHNELGQRHNTEPTNHPLLKNA
ncbi:MAG: glycosyltransferase [Sulfuriferula sp.]|nr:glycosyltransferase [Sulfuriferula sp.]